MIHLLPFLFLLSSTRAHDEYANVPVKATPLGGSLFMLEGAGGNMTASIGPDGVFLVDDDFAPMAEKIVAKLVELKGTSPRYVVNTHFHYDHTGGNEVFGRTATLVSTNETRDRLTKEQVLWRRNHPPVPARALPVLTFEDSLTFRLNEEVIDVVHFPNAHTDGDAAVFFTKAKVASLGDLYFSGMYPIFHPEHGGSLAGVVRALDAILRRLPVDAKIVSGHGPVSDRASLERYRKMIGASISAVRAGVRSGKSLKEIQKAGLPEKWEPFSHGYRTTDEWLESIYLDYTKHNKN